MTAKSKLNKWELKVDEKFIRMPEQRHTDKNPTYCMSLYPAEISYHLSQWKDRPIRIFHVTSDVEMSEMSQVQAVHKANNVEKYLI